MNKRNLLKETANRSLATIYIVLFAIRSFCLPMCFIGLFGEDVWKRELLEVLSNLKNS